jgi:two-component system LytT family sensor kinase
MEPGITPYVANSTAKEHAIRSTANELKVRWRMHEIILVAVITATNIFGNCLELFRMTPQQLESDYVSVYNRNHTHFNYYINVLLPGIGFFLLIYGAYLFINLLIIPSIKRISIKDPIEKIVKGIVWVVVLFMLLSELGALGVNLTTYFAHPWFFNYGGFQFLAQFGYNDHPMTHLFTGFFRSMNLVTFFILVAWAREIVIHQIEKKGYRRTYRILITNQITIFALFYFSILIISNTFDAGPGSFFSFRYLLILLPMFLVFMTNIYWLFPLKGEETFFRYRVLLRLLLSTFVCTFPFFAVAGHEFPYDQFLLFLLCWGGQLFVTTPLSWLIYRQRKDRIMQLRGLEKDLERSKADLQFLRSQINPHFLFNALNTLYGTALREKSADTAKGIQMLGDMMRFMLQENTLDFIPMHKEIEYLKNYISLQKLRIQASPEISIEDHIDGRLCDHPIAPMILIPFVENAFKHGISLEKRSWIKITLTGDEKDIRFEVRNSIHQKRSNDPEKDNTGIGLKNVLERLKLVYPGRHEVQIREDGGEFLVLLVIRP